MKAAIFSFRFILFAGIAALMVYAFFDPAETWWMPKCPVHFLTGFNCPGCGSQRAIHAMLHGDFSGAFRENAILFLVIPFIIVVAFAELQRNRYPSLYRWVTKWWVVGTLTAIIVVWGVVRNLI